MKPSGTGRIIFWSGGSLWIGLSGEPTRFHAHHAIQVSVSLSGEALRFRTPESDWEPFHAAIIAAHASHAFAAPDVFVGMIFIEPESSEGQALSRLTLKQAVVAIDTSRMQDLITEIHALYRDGATDERLAKAARTLIARYADTRSSPVTGPDKRIRRAQQLIRERIGGSIALAEIADAVHLSPDRFRHLFIAETGIRFRPYVLWLRIETALSCYSARKNLTEASHAGGFADSAHFSRTFNRMFGITPSSLKLE